MSGLRVGVTGMGRGGTSLMMQIIRELGCVMYGHADIPHFPREFNPDGYWELNDYEIPQARHDWNSDTHDRVIKAFANVMRDFEIDKYIVMARDVHDAAKSFQKVFKCVGKMTWNGVEKVFDGTYGEALFAVNNLFSACMHYVHKNRKSFIVVDYDELLKDRRGMINRIAKYLDIGSTKGQIDSAVKLVRSK